MVLPRPTSSVMKRFARGSSRAFLRGVSWWSRSLMPARNGDWKRSARVAVTLLHLSAWTHEVARRLRGASPAPPHEGDWPPVPQSASEDEWKQALSGLAAANRDLVAALGDCSPEQLERRVGNTNDPTLGSGQTFGAMVRGLAQHHAYHGGQIILLRRASEFGSSPPPA